VATVSTDQVLDLVRAEAGPDAEAEVLVHRNDLALTRFANSYIHQNVADTTAFVRLRLHIAGRTTAVSTTVVTDDGLRALVSRAIAASRTAPLDPTWPGLTPPAEPTGSGNYDRATAEAEPAERAARVRAFVDAAGNLEAAGFCQTQSWSATFANSLGHKVAGQGSEASLDGIARAGKSDGTARLASVRLADIDGAILGQRAAAKAQAGLDPVELAPGRYEVVLEPTAVADVLAMLGLYGFNGKVFAEQRSFVELGAAQFDPLVTLVDDGAGEDAVGLPFDVEGTPSRRIELVRAGVSNAVVHDRRSAATVGAESTGHALGDSATWGPIARNVALLPDGDGALPSEVDGPAADSSVAALVATIKRGLLVTDNWYTRALDPRSLVVTGLTRNGVWLVENGEVVRPVQNFRFTQSYPQALAPGQVLGIGSYAVPQPGSWITTGFRAPALHLASWNYTGGASG
jgi:predicted Zn-dependent protease